MEENKKNSLTVKQPLVEEKQKLTYEQLSEVCHQLGTQVNKLYAELRNQEMTNTFKRLDYLFKVLEHGEMFEADFLNKCIEEIQYRMTIPEDVKEEKEEDNKEEEKKEE